MTKKIGCKWGSKLLLLLLTLFVLSAGAAFAESKGKVETSSPGFWVVRDGERTDLSVGDDILEFDILATDATGGGTIRFIDDTVLEVRNNSEIDVKEVVFTEDRNRFNVGVVEGTARVITGAIVRQNPRGFKVTTPKSTIGIRGTDLEAGYDPNTGRSTMTVHETETEVTFTDNFTGFSITGAKGLSVTSDGMGGITINDKSYDFTDPTQVTQAAMDLEGVASITGPDGSPVGGGASGGGGEGSGTDSSMGGGGEGGGEGGGSSGGGGGGGGGSDDCSNDNSSPGK